MRTFSHPATPLLQTLPAHGDLKARAALVGANDDTVSQGAVASDAASGQTGGVLGWISSYVADHDAVESGADAAAQVDSTLTTTDAALASSSSASSSSASLYPADPRPPIPSCKVAVLDLAGYEETARCNTSEESVWPRALLNSSDWKTIMGVEFWAGQHATNFWTSKVARALPTYTADEEAADLVVVDSSCLEARILGQRFIARITPDAPKPEQDPHERLIQALEKVTTRPRFRRRMGLDHLTSLHWPGYSMAIRRAFRLGERAFMSVNERSLYGGGSLWNERAGLGVIEPYVAVENIPVTVRPLEERTRLLFVAHGCADGNHPKQYASGKIMRGHLVHALGRLNVTADHVIARCTCGVCAQRIPHDVQMLQMGETRFCPVMPGDSQGTRHLSEVFLSGCIPVFIGPPFSSMPLAEYVDYAATSIFIHVRTKTWFFSGEGSGPINHASLADTYGIDGLNVAPRDIKHLESLGDVYNYLRSIPDDVVRAKLENVKRYRAFFSHVPIPGERRSWLVDAILNSACRVAQERCSFPPP